MLSSGDLVVAVSQGGRQLHGLDIWPVGVVAGERGVDPLAEAEEVEAGRVDG